MWFLTFLDMDRIRNDITSSSIREKMQKVVTEGVMKGVEVALLMELDNLRCTGLSPNTMFSKRRRMFETMVRRRRMLQPVIEEPHTINSYHIGPRVVKVLT